MERQSVADAPTAYGGNWFQSRMAGALASPQRVVPLLIELVGPRSVIDVGCGPGTWLEEFTGQGVEDVLGIEGDWLDTSVARIPPEKLVLHDVTTPLDLGRRFDLALSLEVGEHIPEAAASVLVQTLTRHADVVVFSAAAPLQGGTHHVNERWPEYWTDLFAARGFVSIDTIRPRIWLDEQVAWYYRQNMFLAVRGEVLSGYPALRDEHERAGGRVLPLVHPDRYVRVAKTSPVRLKDSALGTVYERWPTVRRLRDKLRALRATGS
jgi:SAM-dependent methyltransferase